MLYRTHPGNRYLQLVVPTHLREEVLVLAYDIPTAGAPGHQSHERLIKKLLVVSSWIRDTCAICNTMTKTIKPTTHFALQLYHATSPMERVQIDFLGPLPKTKAGNQHVLMMVDQFTKWVECIPLPSQTAEVTTKQE